MKRIILMIIGICCVFITHAQAPLNIVISPGTNVVLSGTVQATMTNGSGTPTFTNNGTYTDNAGTLNDLAGLTFNGSGTTNLYNLMVNLSGGTTLFNSLVSVYNTTTLAAGSMDANNNLYVRSDAGNATLVNNALLTDNVRGIIAKASVTSGGCPSFMSNLTLDITGTEMLYQWQSSPDSAAWSDVTGATNASYTATIAATTFFRCALTTGNTSFSEVTPGVKTALGGLPDAGTITGTATVCTGAVIALTDTITGGTWSSGTPVVATVDASGVVAGITQGTTTISYAVTNGCGTAYAMATVTVNPSPAPISGASSVCNGASLSMSDATTPGVWNESGGHITFSGGSVGVVSLTATSVGTDTIYYTTFLGCISSAMLTINPTPGAISGPGSVCEGSSISMSDGTVGGAWSSGSGSIASISTAGVVTGVMSGTSVISYTLSSDACYTTKVITVNLTPAMPVGPASICSGSSTSLSDITPGGVWNESGGHLTFLGGSVGVVSLTATSPGTDTVYYTIFPGCMSFATITVDATPAAGSITGTTVLCAGTSTSLTDAATGGVWSSSAPSIASVDASGNVTALVQGIAVISYTAANSCGSVNAIAAVTVNPLPDAGTITGIAIVCAGSTIHLSDAASGGNWSSDSPDIGSVDISGTVSGIMQGTTTISYTATNSCGTVAATSTVTVNPLPDAGTINGTTVVCAGTSTSLTDATTGGVWTSSPDASVDGSGNVTGISAGTATISYTVTNSCGAASATSIVTINTTSTGTITGASSVGIGANITLTDAVGGGSWSASNGNATVSGGIVHGVTAGTVTISYVVSGICGAAAATKVISVGTVGTVGAITGYYFYLCAGATTPFFDGTAGGVWSIDPADAGVASVSASGVVSGISAGTARLSYTVGPTSATAVVTVYPVPAAITGISMLCQGSTSSLSDLTPGGSWSSSVVTVASITTAGVVTGAATGTTTIYYTTPTAGCRTSQVLTVSTTPSLIGGANTVCPGSSISLSDLVSGGMWSSTSGASVAVTGSTTAMATGITTGTAIVTYTLGSCYKTHTITVNATPSPILGTTTVCPGATAFFSDTTAGGTHWSSSDTTIAKISASGALTPVATGAATITYTIASGCITTTTVSVIPLPSAITNNSAVCQGNSVTLSDATPSGAWTSNNVAVATVGSTTGTLAGISGGTAMITYLLSGASGCYATAVATVNGITTGTVSGPSTVYTGTTITLTDAVSGGVWSASNSDATVSSGLVTGVSAGTVIISYAVTNSCGTAYATKIVTVNASGVSGISGAATVCVGTTTSLSDATAGGAWSSSNTFNATVSTAGIVTGVAAGTARISYSIAGVPATLVITVNPSPSSIGGAASVCNGSSVTLSDFTAGGTWTSTAGISVTNGTTTTAVTGLTNGLNTVTYSLATGCYKTYNITVNAAPAPISGTLLVCIGSVAHVSDATGGGVSWTSGNTAVATISASGGVTGISSGNANITYTITTGCKATAVVTVHSCPSAPEHDGTTVSGMVSVAAGTVVALQDELANGTWTSSNTTVATVENSGLVTAVSPGVSNVSHVVTSADGSTLTTVTPVVVTNMSIDLRLIPNPNNGTFNLEGTLGAGDNELTIEITDVIGQVIYKNEIAAHEGKVNEMISLRSSLSNGMYILSAQTNNGKTTLHFVIEK